MDERVLPTRDEIIAALSDGDRAILYSHFAGAADPDELIYIAWLWANGWIHDPEEKREWVINPETNEKVLLQVLDLDTNAGHFRILYDHWQMEQILFRLRYREATAL